MFTKRRSTTVFFVTRPEQAPPESFWRPNADVYEIAGGWLLKLELAGVKVEDVNVTAHGSLLKVEGIRRDLTAHEVCRPYSMEIEYNRFERAFDLPMTLDGCEITADLSDGLLLVRVSQTGERK